MLTLDQRHLRNPAGGRDGDATAARSPSERARQLLPPAPQHPQQTRVSRSPRIALSCGMFGGPPIGQSSRTTTGTRSKHGPIGGPPEIGTPSPPPDTSTPRRADESAAPADGRPESDQ